MERNELKQIAWDYMQIWSAGKENLLDEFADENLKVDYTHFEKTYNNIPDYKAMLKQTHEFFPDLQITLNEVIPNENLNSATVFWEYKGTHENGNLFGIESSGKFVSISGITLLQFQGGKVKAEKGIVDNLNLLMQLGALD